MYQILLQETDSPYFSLVGKAQSWVGAIEQLKNFTSLEYFRELTEEHQATYLNDQHMGLIYNSKLREANVVPVGGEFNELTFYKNGVRVNNLTIGMFTIDKNAERIKLGEVIQTLDVPEMKIKYPNHYYWLHYDGEGSRYLATW